VNTVHTGLPVPNPVSESRSSLASAMAPVSAPVVQKTTRNVQVSGALRNSRAII
jgi:hypothetical protein